MSTEITITYNPNGFVTKLEMEFAELVGALSQAVNYCSYNDDSILCSLLQGTLNNEVVNRNAEYGPDSNRARIESETGYPVR